MYLGLRNHCRVIYILRRYSMLIIIHQLNKEFQYMKTFDQFRKSVREFDLIRVRTHIHNIILSVFLLSEVNCLDIPDFEL